jgi:hypothetical protein
MPNKLTVKETELQPLDRLAQLQNIPEELRLAKSWVHCSADKRPDLKYATPQDRADNLRSLDHLLKRPNAKTGGFQYWIGKESGFVFIDLDHCRNAETGDITAEARTVIERLNSYTEISASGTGIHIIARGVIPRDLPNRPPVEIYSGNHPNKLFMLTGDVLEMNYGIETRQDELNQLLNIEEVKRASVQPVTPFDPIWIENHVPSVNQLTSEPVKWVVDRMVPYGGLTMFLGAQGSLKSYTSLNLAQCIYGAVGVPWESASTFGKKSGRDPSSFFVGRRVAQGCPVLFLDRENPEGEIGQRARKMGIRLMPDFKYWGDFNPEGTTPEPDDPRLAAWAKEHRGLIIFDSLQDWYGDASEIDNTAMVKLMGKFRKLARTCAGVVLLHHKSLAGKKERTHEGRGGTAIVGLTDMAISVQESESDPSVLEFRASRFRMTAKWEIDARVHWQSGETPFFQFEVLRDENVADVIRKENRGKAIADREEQEAQNKLNAAITVELEKDPQTNLNALLKKVSADVKTTRYKVEKAVAELGWVATPDGFRRQVDFADETPN